ERPREFWGVTYTNVFEAAVGVGNQVLVVAWECAGRPLPDAATFDAGVIEAQHEPFNLNLQRFGHRLLNMPEPSRLLARIRWRMFRAPRWPREVREALRAGPGIDPAPPPNNPVAGAAAPDGHRGQPSQEDAPPASFLEFSRKQKSLLKALW